MHGENSRLTSNNYNMSKKISQRGRPKNFARIHYGANPASGEPLYWRVRVRDAKELVRVNGRVIDAIKGVPGNTIGCHLSHCVMDNERAFSHPVKLASFTRSVAYIINKIKGGRPVEAFRYTHACSDLVDLNDTDVSKRYVREHPEIAGRSFVLRPPVKRGQRRKSARTHGEAAERQSRPRIKTTAPPRGALARAAMAGLVSKGFLSVLGRADEEMGLLL
jgi:hypothetical protein